MENNFKCPECNKEYFIPKYSIRSVSGQIKFFEDNKINSKEIVCKDDKEPLLSIKNKGELGFNFGKFQAMSPLEKQASLRKRARADGKKIFKQNGYDNPRNN